MISRAALLEDSLVSAVGTASEGVGTVAARDLARGDCILRARPCGVAFRFSELGLWCHSCHRHGPDCHLELPLRCSDCQLSWCSEECRHNDTATHSLLCRAVADIQRSAKSIGSEAATQARWACAILAASASPKPISDSSSLTMTSDNLGAAEMKVDTSPGTEPQQPRLEHVLDMVKVKCGKKPTKSDRVRSAAVRALFSSTEGKKLASACGADAGTVQAVLAALPLNSFGFYRDGESRGSGAYPAASIFNHSCYPNVGYRREGCILVFYALDRVQSGDDLHISYLDLSTTSAERQSALIEQWGFRCRCIRCKMDNSGLGSETSAKEKHMLDNFNVINVCDCGAVLPPAMADVHRQSGSGCLCDSYTSIRTDRPG
eukprot:m.462430 g.462430  ORF g.462430 m.462430 type:complete len:375 (-) comp22650_c0_seq1:279-1403(-)